MGAPPVNIVLRDAGGIGDIVRIFAVLDALAARGPTVFYTDACYRDLCQLCPSVASGAVEPRFWMNPRARFPGGDLRTWGDLRREAAYAGPDFPDEAPVIDLFCPALQHELVTRAKPRLDRLACWARAAGLPPPPPGSVRLSVPPEARQRAQKWAQGLRRPVVAVSPSSNAAIRTWRNGASRAGRTGLVGELVRRLRALRYTVVLFGTGLMDCSADLLSVTPDIRDQAARLAECDAFVGPDSGMLHLACAQRVPTVTMFGPTHAHLVLRPYDGKIRVLRGEWDADIRRRVGCSGPCYGFAAAGYNGTQCAGRCHVLEQVQEQDVADAVHALLTRRKSIRAKHPAPHPPRGPVRQPGDD